MPHLLRRYPPEDHEDFALPPDVVIFCQPEGCDRVESTINAYNGPTQIINSFVFLLTEKDTSRVRYGICLNHYRPLQECPHRQQNSTTWAQSDNQRQDTNDGDQRDACKASQSSSSTQCTVESGFRVSSGIDSDSIGSGKVLEQLQSDADNQKVLTSRDDMSGSLGNADSIVSSSGAGRHQRHCEIIKKNDDSIGDQKDNCKLYHQKYTQSRKRRTNPSIAPSEKSKITYALNSICIISHHPFFSTFRECLYIIKKFIQACDDRNLNLMNSKDSQPKCKCYSKFYHRSRKGSQQSRRSQVSRHSLINHHTHTCPFSNPIWALLTMPDLDENSIDPATLNDVAEVEAWLLRLLSVPVPVPEKTKVEVDIMTSSLKQPLLFALPDHTRFSLIDFPLHLPLELLGVQTCLQVLTCILLEHKVALQSKDYNALSMSVMAFVTMIYPLEYMFPVIPLLPSCMSSAEQLLLAPTPFIIGFPSSFFKFKFNFTLPNDVWIVDLDANKVKKPTNVEDLPPLPEYEGNILVQNLQKILNSMSGIDAAPKPMPQHQNDNSNSVSKVHSLVAKTTKLNDTQTSTTSSPFKRRPSMAAANQLLQFAANKLSGTPTNSSNASSPASSTRSSFAAPCVPDFNPLTIINNDTDAVDVAARTAMVRFFNSQEVLANFIEHTRTIRLYPRPVVSFQKSSFLQSRAKLSTFLVKLVETQAVEYMAEWALCPDNVAFQRIQTGVYDPATIGDKPKWYGNQLKSLKYQIWDSDKREFYDDIASIIRDSSSVSGAASSTGRFSDYYDDAPEKAGNHSDDGDENRQYASGVAFISDINNNTVVDGDQHSPYMSSNDSSPCYSSDRETETNWMAEKETDAGILAHPDVLDIHSRKSSASSSVSSTGSWDTNHYMQSIPPNYHHDIGRFPPIRCDIKVHFKPSNSLVQSSEDAKRSCSTSEPVEDIEKQVRHLEPSDSSDDENDSSKVVPDSSSCDESGTEEFDFNSLHPKDSGASLNLEDGTVVKLFESVDSDTIVASNNIDTSLDENNNITPKSPRDFSTEASLDSVSVTGAFDSARDQPSEIEAAMPSPGAKSDTVNAISSCRSKVATGVTKLIDRASSVSDSKFLKQNSQSSGNQSPLPKNLGTEQMGAFFDRVTSEAKGAVKEARAAIDAGKIALKTSAMPAADIGRQKLIRNFQNLGEAFFDDRRSSTSTRDPTNITHDSGHQSTSLGHQQSRTTNIGPDLSNIAGKANSMFSDWLGSKATGFANRVRDRTGPLAPFPSSKLNF